MRKFWATFLTLLMLVCAIGLTACTTPEHSHSYTNGKCSCGKIDPTYMSNGLVLTLNEQETEYSVTGYTGSDRDIYSKHVFR